MAQFSSVVLAQFSRGVDNLTQATPAEPFCTTVRDCAPETAARPVITSHDQHHPRLKRRQCETFTALHNPRCRKGSFRADWFEGSARRRLGLDRYLGW